MAFEVRIENKKGIFKKQKNLFVENIFELLGEEYDFGYQTTISKSFRYFEENINLKQILTQIMKKGTFGRGIYLGFDGDDVALSLPVPCVKTDIELLETVAKKLSAYYGNKDIYVDGVKKKVTDELITTDQKDFLLYSFSEIKKGAIIPAFHNWIYMEDEIVTKIQDADKEEQSAIFTKYLADLQSEDLYYLNGALYQDKAGSYHVVYSIVDNNPSIIPNEVYTPFIDENYHVHISGVIYEGEALGAISYEEFLKRIANKTLKKYDQNNSIITLSTEELREIFQ